jgi:3-hydroxyacyl-CoA dehydrogenase
MPDAECVLAFFAHLPFAMSSVDRFTVRKAAVLGAGVMGAQIAAHLVNAYVAARALRVAGRRRDPQRAVRKAIDNLRGSSPAPLSLPSRADFIARRITKTISTGSADATS